MPNAEDVYINCDDLERIPALMRANYLHESRLLARLLPQKCRVLQVGSMDGERGIRLLAERSDLQLTGLEIEKQLVRIAEKKVTAAKLNIRFINGDITDPPTLPKSDYVICLNNTLGYIPDQQKALEAMEKLGKQVIVSVYGEKFTDELARQYFDSLGLTVDYVQDDMFVMKDFTMIKRYSREEVKTFSTKIINTPIGYLTFTR